MEKLEPTTEKELIEWAKSAGLEWVKASVRCAYPWIFAKADCTGNWYIITKGRSELDGLQRAYAIHEKNP